MAEEAGGRWLFKVQTPRFFKIIWDDPIRQGKLSLPKAFAVEHGAQLANKALLKLPGGAEWQVRVRRSCDEIWFQEGWKEFAKFYSLAPHHFLVFEYNISSHGHFDVLIFDKTATEIKYPAHRAYVDLDPESETDDLNETWDDHHHFFFPKARGKRASISPQPRQLKRVRFESGRTGENSMANKQGKRAMTSTAHSSRGKEHEDNQAGKRNRRVQRRVSLKGAEKASALASAKAAFGSKNPSFMLVMQPAYVCSTGMSVNLPRWFFERNLEGKLRGIIMLQVAADGRRASWEVGYSVHVDRKKATFVNKSWIPFAKENNLEVGDVCAFELVENNGGSSIPVFNVVIFRAAHHPNHKLGNGTRSRSFGKARLYGTASSGVSKAAVAFTSKQPFFKIAVAPSHLTMGQVHIPAAFHEHVKEVYDEVELRVVGSKCWEVSIRRCLLKNGSGSGRQVHLLLGRGWSVFAAGNSLEVGDVCVYELVKPEDERKRVMVLRVHIYRG